MAKQTGVGGPVSGVGGPVPSRDQHHLTPVTGAMLAGTARAGIRLIVSMLVLAGIAATAFVIISRMDSATPASAAPESTSTASSQLESPAVGSTQTTHPKSVLARLPPTGPGLTYPGILVIATPAPDGSFNVLERILMVSTVSVLTLRPAPADLAGHQFASARAGATRVQVTAGDRPVVVPGAKVDARLDLPVAQVSRFELSYRLTGVTVISSPSKPGRALAAIGPLTGGVDRDLPVLFIVTGETILGLNCPLLPLSQQSCGNRVQTSQSYERELPWRLALTSVQFNLPPA